VLTIDAVDEIKKGMSAIETMMAAQLRGEVLDWLGPLLNSQKQDQKSSDRPRIRAGQWLLESEEFKEWVEYGRWELRCYGECGTGKVRYRLKCYKQTFSVESDRPIRPAFAP
jgi:hypothetical protein